ncbi:shikimate dehydrogenase [Phreatobacter aquaticus]|uniref:Shikimate dehydrogenase n=1 Tax=Phreatobacter aquaticus TaxID=2570229 RepID=A0A4D7QQX9_9HYPH|nr:shikimate dehydrogenase [Phreatobacter aquaticus]QCK87909.1 shikimate dehydrogenase [Phreatobacter aquaticus]
MRDVRLGLIGDKIARSRSPDLHRLAGQLCGLNVTYDRLIPPERGQSFDQVFDHCRDTGYRGVNVTYPYKETVVRRLGTLPPALQQLGACNTVVFGEGLPTGANTDSTGFARGFRTRFPGAQPGIVAMAGTGGVGKAIAFALASLGASELRLCDPDSDKAQGLAQALKPLSDTMRIVIAPDMQSASEGADGLVNATPLGMDGVGGNAVPTSALAGRHWAFDAVYTPEETAFLIEARASGLAIMSGFELFLFQGIDAFAIFTGEQIDAEALRAELARAADTAELSQAS